MSIASLIWETEAERTDSNTWQDERNVVPEALAKCFVDTSGQGGSTDEAARERVCKETRIQMDSDGADRLGRCLRQAELQGQSHRECKLLAMWGGRESLVRLGDVPYTFVKGLLCSRHWARCWGTNASREMLRMQREREIRRKTQ